MLQLFLKILPLALGAAISPVVVAATVFVLSSKEKSIVKTSIFLLGVLTPLLIIGLPGVSLMKDLTTQISQNTGQSGSKFIDLIFGVILIALAIKNIFEKQTDGKKRGKEKPKAAKTLSFYKLFLTGIGAMVTNFTTLVLFVPAVKEISISAIPLIEKYAVFLVLLLITMILPLIPYAACIIAPNRAKSIFELIGKISLHRNRKMLIVIFLILGAYLIIKAFHG